MNFERLYQQWQAKRSNSPGQAHALIAESAKSLEQASTDDLVWLASSLTDDQRKFFTAAMYSETSTLPDGMYDAMLQAAVNETNPLQVHAFVDPCIKSSGFKRAFIWLLKIVETGTDFEKAGAVNALHWVNRKRAGEGVSDRHQVDVELMQALQHQRNLYLRTFINTEDVDLRRSLITYCDLNEMTATTETKALIDKVVKIARSNSDQYIKSRIEVQLGRAPSQYPLPPRAKPTINAQKTSWWKQLWK